MSLLNLIPWRGKQSHEPATMVSPAQRMKTEMDRLVDRFFHDPWGSWDVPSVWGESATVPVEVSETDKDVTVRAEIPGVDPKDLDLQVSGDVLTIAGQKEQASESKENDCYLSEVHYGSFRRGIRLPASVDANQVTAEYAQGVLTVRLGKSAEAQAKRIAIKTN